MRKWATSLAIYVSVISGSVFAAEMTVYKSPYCGCCGKWVEHAMAAGHSVKTVDTEDMAAIKKLLGVPEPAQSCHTTVVEGYVIEGHVPIADVERLLAERPKARGLAVPGMPTGSPGMEMPGEPADNYDVYLFDGERASIYSRY